MAVWLEIFMVGFSAVVFFALAAYFAHAIWGPPKEPRCPLCLNAHERQNHEDLSKPFPADKEER
jgi:hypothetical protein